MAVAILENLNSRQREAVLYDDSGALILAGAGTGKTRVLTGKVIYLLSEKKIPPAHIIAVTFTNKAAQEMKSRIQSALPIPPRGLLLGTFHSICHRLLRIHAQAAGLDKNFQIMDAQDQKTFITRLLREHDINDKDFPPQEVRAYISHAKEHGYRADKVPTPTARGKQMARIYQLYESACFDAQRVDFAELILAVIELLRRDEPLRQHYAQRFRYVLVDEFQDTNLQQFELLRLLDSKDNRFFAVGDDDQSIYTFRGAEPGIMNKFQSELRAHKLLRLEENYRSVKNILDAANHLIINNPNRLGKTLVTKAATGAKIEVLPAASDEVEAKAVAQLISQHIKAGNTAQEVAVLYRINAQARLLERELMYYGVPYRVYGGMRFYDRMEIKHALAYLRLLVSDDRDALLRIINFPPRGIGKKTQETLAAGGDLFAAVAECAHQSVKNFNRLLNNLRRAEGDMADKLRAVLEQSGLIRHYEEQGESERVENLQELVNAAAQFERYYDDTDEEAGESLLAFLSTVALESSGEHVEHSPQAVNLMTVHAAKGLEFKRIHIVGMEEGLFPHERSLEQADDKPLEEERRLLYVAITRARESLFLHFAYSRMLYGRLGHNLSSRFLDELPMQCLSNQDWRIKPSEVMNVVQALSSEMETARENMSTPPPPKLRSTHGGLRVGDGVRHKKYGNGVVMRRYGRGEEEQLEVFFKTAGTKLFKTALARLEKL